MPAQEVGECDCARQDLITPTWFIGTTTCGGGIACLSYQTLNWTQAPYPAHGHCLTTAPESACYEHTEALCKFNAYDVYIIMAACAPGTACLNSKNTALVTYTNLNGGTTNCTLSAANLNCPIGGTTGYNFSVPNKNCKTGPYFLRITVTAGGATIYEVARRVTCEECPAKTS